MLLKLWNRTEQRNKEKAISLSISANQNRKLSVIDALRHLALATVDLLGLVNNNCSSVALLLGFEEASLNPHPMISSLLQQHCHGY